ncbi:MAG: HTH-type transcriptional regulator [Candidatus Electronema aureum]|uniref:HTH-type transcriptional regulator n=1 Tax=Candidatus Electronema aureum TaxID=2005002 RepID=A0A521G5A7_9BACT|nr:MAG: HTH-type transcriptional regulator [Candidatus Electronema aureum]
MDMKPIRSEAEYQQALAEIERLFAAEADTADGDQLNMLTILVEAYEKGRYDLPKPDPVEAILYQMESRGLSRKDLEPFIGTRARVAEIINRQRSLSLPMIQKLHTGLGIAADVLIQPYKVAAAKAKKLPRPAAAASR